jgi:hypothetical protein
MLREAWSVIRLQVSVPFRILYPSFNVSETANLTALAALLERIIRSADNIEELLTDG